MDQAIATQMQSRGRLASAVQALYEAVESPGILIDALRQADIKRTGLLQPHHLISAIRAASAGALEKDELQLLALATPRQLKAASGGGKADQNAVLRPASPGSSRGVDIDEFLDAVYTRRLAAVRRRLCTAAYLRRRQRRSNARPEASWDQIFAGAALEIGLTRRDFVVRLGGELAVDVVSPADLGRLFEFALQASTRPPPPAGGAEPAMLDRQAFVRFMAPAGEFGRLASVTEAAVKRLRKALAGCGLPSQAVIELLASHAHRAPGASDEWDRLLTVRAFQEAMSSCGLGRRAGLAEADLAFVVAELASEAAGGGDAGAVTMPVKAVCALLMRPGNAPSYTPSADLIGRG